MRGRKMLDGVLFPSGGSPQLVENSRLAWEYLASASMILEHARVCYCLAGEKHDRWVRRQCIARLLGGDIRVTSGRRDCSRSPKRTQVEASGNERNLAYRIEGMRNWIRDITDPPAECAILVRPTSIPPEHRAACDNRIHAEPSGDMVQGSQGCRLLARLLQVCGERVRW